MAKREEGYYREVWQVGVGRGRMFGDFFLHISHGPLGFTHIHAAPWPPVDVIETEEGFVVRAEIAGMRPNEMEVTFEEGMLVIRGKREVEAPPGARFHQVEISHGRFERRIPIPGEVDVEGIKARYREGFLVVELPRPARKEREVTVEVE
ncbi:MAG TPA: Hsp20/alpha crystallin family protein [Armatimonadetes bacterium]|nr:Hsp20/alpha crystallin family protein [Armatimonadota bacterium]